MDFSMYSEVSYKREDMMMISEPKQGTAHNIPSFLLQFDESQTNIETFITFPHSLWLWVHNIALMEDHQLSFILGTFSLSS